VASLYGYTSCISFLVAVMGLSLRTNCGKELEEDFLMLGDVEDILQGSFDSQRKKQFHFVKFKSSCQLIYSSGHMPGGIYHLLPYNGND